MDRTGRYPVLFFISNLFVSLLQSFEMAWYSEFFETFLVSLGVGSDEGRAVVLHENVTCFFISETFSKNRCQIFFVTIFNLYLRIWQLPNPMPALLVL